MQAENRAGVYVVSKIRHAPMWRDLQTRLPIISSWINDGRPDEIDFSEAWPRYLREATNSIAMIVYVEGEDDLKGGMLEIGAGLAGGSTVYVVGNVRQLVTAKLHDRIILTPTITEAVTAVYAMLDQVPPSNDPQQRIGSWVVDVYGMASLLDLMERGYRCIEEVLELGQVLGVPPSMVSTIMNRVYKRPVGDLRQEVSGVVLTAMALAEAAGFRVDDVVADELHRIHSLPREFFVAKHQEKVIAGTSRLTGEENRA